MDKFKPGDRVETIRVPDAVSPTGRWNFSPDIIGKRGTVTSTATLDNWGLWRYDVQLDNGEKCEPIEQGIVPIYDGDTVVSWETCAWRPKERDLAKTP
jgi:hypothetical protein